MSQGHFSQLVITVLKCVMKALQKFTRSYFLTLHCQFMLGRVKTSGQTHHINYRCGEKTEASRKLRGKGGGDC